ncbi:MAG: hypothetical protein GKR90_01610 [Pseudomonadales bacterium]|nr:hypothetical protein [Pseudomonadales bacterium]
MSDQRFSQHDIDHYHEHGFVVLENFLSQQELDDVYDDVERLLPGWRYAVDSTLLKPDGWQEPPERATNPRFPFPGAGLNGVTFHPELRRFAATVTGHDDLFCEQSDLTYKCQNHSRDADQNMHMDFGNHTLAYPSSNPKFWQTAYLIYYTDVTERLAPTAVCSWQHYKDEVHWPAIHSRQQRPDLYENEVLMTVPAGSVFAYSTRTYHRGTKFLGEGGRVAHFVTYAPKNCPWLGIVGWPTQGVRGSFQRWMEQSSLADRETIGFPPVGHEYWTEEMVRGVQARFPQLDMSPYRSTE